MGPRADRTPPPRHEDGTVRFWDASGVSLKPLYKLGTANIFQTDCEHNDSLNQAGEEEWPPFRKVRSPGQGDTAVDLGTLQALPALEGASPELGTGDAPAGAIPAAPRGRVPQLRAQLLCDALWGQQGMLVPWAPSRGSAPAWGKEPGGVWGQSFPGRDAQSGPCATAGGGMWGCMGGCPTAVCRVLAVPSSVPSRRWAALIPTAMTHAWACRRLRSASTRPRWWWLARRGR